MGVVGAEADLGLEIRAIREDSLLFRRPLDDGRGQEDDNPAGPVTVFEARGAFVLVPDPSAFEIPADDSHGSEEGGEDPSFFLRFLLLLLNGLRIDKLNRVGEPIVSYYNLKVAVKTT